MVNTANAVVARDCFVSFLIIGVCCFEDRIVPARQIANIGELAPQVSIYLTISTFYARKTDHLIREIRSPESSIPAACCLVKMGTGPLI